MGLADAARHRDSWQGTRPAAIGDTPRRRAGWRACSRASRGGGRRPRAGSRFRPAGRRSSRIPRVPCPSGRTEPGCPPLPRAPSADFSPLEKKVRSCGRPERVRQVVSAALVLRPMARRAHDRASSGSSSPLSGSRTRSRSSPKYSASAVTAPSDAAPSSSRARRSFTGALRICARGAPSARATCTDWSYGPWIRESVKIHQ